MSVTYWSPRKRAWVQAELQSDVIAKEWAAQPRKTREALCKLPCCKRSNLRVTPDGKQCRNCGRWVEV